MSSTPSASSQNAAMSLVKFIGVLPTAIVKKLTGSDEIAPLFVAPCVDDEDFDDFVKLACGHILRSNDAGEARKGGGVGFLGSIANLSIFEATRCPFCDSGRFHNQDDGSEGGFGGGAVSIAGQHTMLDGKRELCGLERPSTADEQDQDERGDRMLLELSTDERVGVSFGETLMGACRRAKKALSIKGAGGSRVGFEGA